MVRLPFTAAEHLPLAVSTVRESLRQHAVAALPTETFYGLAVDPADAEAVARVLAIKRRGEEKALLVVGASEAQLEKLVAFPSGCRERVERVWPAPLTVVLPARVPLPAGGKTLAVRVPAHELLLALLARVGPLTATSANRTGEAPFASPEAVAGALGGELAVLLDGGDTPGAAPSTLLDWTRARPRMLRAGAFPVPPEWCVLGA